MKKMQLIIGSVLAVLLLSVQSLAQPVVFNYTATIQMWTVPACVTSITVDVQGAMGGHGVFSRGGYGGRAQCTLTVTPGQVFYIFVGGMGDTGVAGGPTLGGAGGYNGGANGGVQMGTYAGGGGGGASDLRTGGMALSNRVVVAGGGGGAGYNYHSTDYDRGGNGGGITGQAGWFNNLLGGAQTGGGGTASAGGAGGVYSGYTSGVGGALAFGGIGGSNNAGGGGGGGLYGGGGGAWAGGGGGSSYTDPGATAVTHTQGFNTTGHGVVTITPGCMPAGAITGTSFVACAGSTLNVNNPTSVSCGYWSSSNTAVATIGSSTGIITGVSGGTATITYNISNPCGGTSATHTVTINPMPAPITGVSTLCVGNTITLSDTTAFGGWFSMNPAVATVGVSSGIVTGVSIGSAVIDYSLITGCMSTATVNVTCAVGVPQTTVADKYEVSLYPNPVSDELVIKTTAGVYSSVVITNSVGEVIQHMSITGGETKANVKALPAGIYFVSLKGENGVVTRRFVKVE